MSMVLTPATDSVPASDITHGEQLNGSNTGIVGAGLTYADLTPAGSIKSQGTGTAQDPEIIEGFDCTGYLRVDDGHNHVTFRNCRAQGGVFLADNRFGGQGVRFEWCEIYGATPDGPSNLVYNTQGGDLTLYRCDVWDGAPDGVKNSGGSKLRIEESWVHDQYRGPGTHSDSFQMQSGGSVEIVRSRLEAPYQTSNAAILLQAKTGNIAGPILVEDCLLSGGSYTFYLTEVDGFTHGDVRIRGNVWADDSWSGGAFTRGSDTNGSTPVAEWSDNVLAPVVGDGSSPIQVDLSTASDFNL